MLAVKRVKLPASGRLNRQDKPLTRRGMFPVKICGIHSLVRYSREVLNRSTARASGVFRDEKRAPSPNLSGEGFLSLKEYLHYFLKTS